MNRRTEVAKRSKKLFTLQSLPPWFLVAFDRLAWLVERGGDVDFLATNGLMALAFFREWATVIGVLWLGYLLLRSSGSPALPAQELPTDPAGEELNLTDAPEKERAPRHQGEKTAADLQRTVGQRTAKVGVESPPDDIYVRLGDGGEAIRRSPQAALVFCERRADYTGRGGDTPSVLLTWHLQNVGPCRITSNKSIRGMVKMNGVPLATPPSCTQDFGDLTYLAGGTLSLRQYLTGEEDAQFTDLRDSDQTITFTFDELNVYFRSGDPAHDRAEFNLPLPQIRPSGIHM